MKIVDKIEQRESAEALAEDRREDLFTMLVTGKDATEEVETSRGRFVVKYPKPADLVLIGRIASARRNHRPPESLDAETETINAMASTLDVVVASGPKWFEDAKQANQNFSFMEVPSRAFLAELYGKAYSFREEVERRLNQAEEPGDKRVSAEAGADDAVGRGAFGGLSG